MRADSMKKDRDERKMSWKIEEGIFFSASHREEGRCAGEWRNYDVDRARLFEFQSESYIYIRYRSKIIIFRFGEYDSLRCEAEIADTIGPHAFPGRVPKLILCNNLNLN